MDIIEQLIKSLEEAKEELTKNMNCHPSAKPNMAKEELEKDSANPALAPKDVKVKQLQAQIDAGTYKPNAGKIADKMLKDEDRMVAKEEMLACGEGCEMKDMKTHANGQWSMKKSAFKELENKLEHEGKSKESAGAIAYSIGKKKYGKEGMEHKAEAAKKSDE